MNKDEIVYNLTKTAIKCACKKDNYSCEVLLKIAKAVTHGSNVKTAVEKYVSARDLRWLSISLSSAKLAKQTIVVKNNPTNTTGDPSLLPVPLDVTKRVAESAEKHFSNLYPTKVITGYGDSSLNKQSPGAGINVPGVFGLRSLASVHGVEPAAATRMSPHITTHELTHSDLPWGNRPLQKTKWTHSDALTKEQWMKYLGVPDEFLPDEYLANQLAGEEDRAESGMFKLYAKDKTLDADLQKMGMRPEADIKRFVSDHRDAYVNGGLSGRKTHQLTGNEFVRLPVNTAFVEGQKLNFRRNANRGLLINPHTKERVSQFSPPEWADQDVLHHYPIDKQSRRPNSSLLVHNVDLLAKAHEEQIKDMQDYYNPNGTVRQRSYQQNPITKKWEIIAPQFLIQSENSALRQFDKDIPTNRRWMYSPANRIYNAHSPIITHSGYSADAITHPRYEMIRKPATWVGLFHGEYKPTQSADINKQILLNVQGSSNTALMHSNPMQKFPSLRLRAANNQNTPAQQPVNPNSTNNQIGYTGPKSPPLMPKDNESRSNLPTIYFAPF